MAPKEKKHSTATENRARRKSRHEAEERAHKITPRRLLASVGVALAVGLGGVGLAACTSTADTADSTSQSQTGSGAQDSAAGQNGQSPFSSIDTAALATALDTTEDKVTEAIQTVESARPTDGAPGGQAGGRQGSGSAGTGQAGSSTDSTAQAQPPQGAQSGSSDSSGTGSGEDPMAAQLATALDMEYDTVLSALQDAGYTSGGPGAQQADGANAGATDTSNDSTGSQETAAAES